MRERIEQRAYRWYCFLEKNSLFRGILRQLYHLCEIMQPQSVYKVSICAFRLFLQWLFLCGSLFFIFVLRRKSDFFEMGMILSIIYLFGRTFLTSWVVRKEELLLNQLEGYLSEFRHTFCNNATIEDALFDSLETAAFPISLHIEQLYRILIEEQVEAESYQELAPHPLFLIFLSLCQILKTYGDTKKEKKSVFLSNLNHLKNEVHTELLKKQKIKHAFSGLSFLILSPILFLHEIEKWAVGNLPSLKNYYYGTYGNFAVLFIYFITVVIYLLVSKMKMVHTIEKRTFPFLEKMSFLPIMRQVIEFLIEHRARKVERIHQLLKKVGNGLTVRQYFARKICLFCITCCLGMLFFLHIVQEKRWNLLQSVDQFYFEQEIGKTKQETLQAQKILQSLLQDWSKTRNNKSLSKKKKARYFKIYGEKKMIPMIKELQFRQKQYQQIKYHTIYFVISVLFAFILCQASDGLFYFRLFLQGREKEDEVMQFQMIILMLMYLPKVNVERILTWLEQNSHIFREALTACLDRYSYNEEEALHKLKEEEPFFPFVRIVENLEACDRVGIEQAFDELVGERDYYLEKRKQENDILIENRAAFARVIAYLPLVVILGCYLIIPFIVESISELMKYFVESSGI